MLRVCPQILIGPFRGPFEFSLAKEGDNWTGSLCLLMLDIYLLKVDACVWGHGFDRKYIATARNFWPNLCHMSINTLVLRRSCVYIGTMAHKINYQQMSKWTSLNYRMSS